MSKTIGVVSTFFISLLLWPESIQQRRANWRGSLGSLNLKVRNDEQARTSFSFFHLALLHKWVRVRGGNEQRVFSGGAIFGCSVVFTWLCIHLATFCGRYSTTTRKLARRLWAAQSQDAQGQTASPRSRHVRCERLFVLQCRIGSTACLGSEKNEQQVCFFAVDTIVGAIFEFARLHSKTNWLCLHLVYFLPTFARTHPTTTQIGPPPLVCSISSCATTNGFSFFNLILGRIGV